MARRIAQIPEQDRPREKLIAKGAAALSDQELLAVLLGRGTVKVDVLTLAGRIAKIVDDKGQHVAVEDLMGLDGVGQARAAQIVAAMEYVRRRIKPEGLKINTPADVLPLIRHFADRKQEHLLAVTINGANEVMNVRVVTIGLVDRGNVHPREVFSDALADRASGVVVAHNHPAGSLAPSQADIEATRQLKATGDVVGIPLLDHIIFNQKGYYSFLEAGVL